jgi:hypothetical protein
MFAEKRLIRWTTCFSLCALCLPLYAQQQDGKQRQVHEQGAASYRTPEPSDLAQENLNRVAASAAQIRLVLAKDEGLLVELKRWVAKEATDNGQVVDDSSLTDQAIFDRLEQDVVFRSVATRLLQRYGYLLPAANPDSDLGKEKELILKERARRLVQIEAQEDSESLRPHGNNQDLEQTATCDPRLDQDCPQSLPSQRRRRPRPRTSVESSSPQTTPQTVPEQPQQQQNLPRIMQADGLPQPQDLRESASLAAGFELTSSPLKRNASPSDGSQSLGEAIDGLPVRPMVPSPWAKPSMACRWHKTCLLPIACLELLVRRLRQRTKWHN